MSWALLAPVSHHARGALHNLSGFAFLVDFAQTSPFTKLHVGINLKGESKSQKLKDALDVHLDQRDAVLHAQSCDQLLVHGLVAVLGQDTEQCLPFVQGLGGLPDTTGKAVSNESLLEDLLDGGVDVHGSGWDDSGWDFISLNIRHGEFLDVWGLKHKSRKPNKNERFLIRARGRGLKS